MTLTRGEKVRIRGLRGHFVVMSVGKDEKWVSVFGPTEAAQTGGRAMCRAFAPERVQQGRV